MTHSRLIDKIKKLLSMANNNPNKHESEIAMRRANKLLKEHDLTMLSLSEVEEEQISMSVEGGVTPWTRIIYRSVAKLYSCQYFVTHKFSEKMHVVVGNESNRVTTTLIAEQLIDIIRKESRGKGNGFRNSASMSVENTCLDILAENARNSEEVIAGTGLVPVDIHNKRVSANSDFCSKHFNLSSGRGSRLSGSSAGSAFGAGLSVNIRMSNKRALN